MTAAHPLRSRLNALATGLLFGLLQWGSFFVLQSYLSSTALVWLLASLVWLAGSLWGLTGHFGRLSERTWLALSLGAYVGLGQFARAFPYDLALLPVLLGLLAVMGIYAGRFFRLRPARGPAGAKWLFFLENTGFVAGLLATVFGLFSLGEGWLLAAPAGTTVLCWLTLPLAPPAPAEQ